MHNLFISYDITNKETDVERVKKACSALGNSTALLGNTWYVNSQFNADEALKRIGGAFKEGDVVIVLNTKTNSCTWLGLDEKAAKRVTQNWDMNLKASLLEAVPASKKIQ